MGKLLIVDGCALLFQSFYGMPNKILNKKGDYIEAVICFLGILNKTINLVKPSKLFIVFDGENELDRQNIDKNYKKNRKDFSLVDKKDNPFAQLPLIKLALTYLNYTWFEAKNCEADDIIASIVNDYKQTFKIIISSTDKDFYQLIDENVNVFTYRGKISKVWTNNEIKLKYGFDAKYFSTYKALVGDVSDNIKGLKGVGKAISTKLIKDYGDYKEILNNLDNLSLKVKKIVSDNKEKIVNNFLMINLTNKTGLIKLPNCDFIQTKENSVSILKNLDFY